MFAGKTWGNGKNYPVILLHGILDNCCFFDRLIRLLPPSFFYMAIDLPGHGKSSNFPNGVPLEFLNYFISVRYAVDHYKCQKFNLIGHNFGGQIGMFLAAMYPERVDKIVCLEGIIPEPIPLNETVEKTMARLNNIYSCVPSVNKPSYSLNEAADKLLASRFTELNDEAKQNLLSRSLTAGSEGCRLSNDDRLKAYWRVPMTLEQIECFVKRVQNPVLLIIGRNIFSQLIGENYLIRLESYIKEADNIKIAYVKGSHDVHIIHPERVAVHIGPYFNGFKCNL